MDMPDRREMLSRGIAVAGMLAAAGLWPASARAAWNGAAFDAKTMADALKALGLPAPTVSNAIELQAPEIAENGAVVPLAVSTTLPGVQRLLLLVEKNPAALSAVFEVNDAIEPSFGTRVKMAQTSNVIAVAITADGRAQYVQKEVKVTLGGCGG